MADRESSKPAEGTRKRLSVPRWLRITVIGLAVLFVLAGLGGVGTIVGVFWYYGRNVDDIDEQALRDYRPPQVTRVLDRRGACSSGRGICPGCWDGTVEERLRTLSRNMRRKRRYRNQRGS